MGDQIKDRNQALNVAAGIEDHDPGQSLGSKGIGIMIPSRARD